MFAGPPRRITLPWVWAVFLIVPHTSILTVYPILPGPYQEAEPSMADTFDPYREALVVETATIWPAGTELDPRERYQLEAVLHAHPQEAAQLEYVRMHTGFCRKIIVTDEDLARVTATS